MFLKQTIPEGRDIRDFTVGISFLKNIIKSLLLKRHKIGDEVECIPSQTLKLMTLDPHSITTMASFSTIRDVLKFVCLFIALYCSPHSIAQVQGCTHYTGK